jgi:hypothetical protein
MRAKTFVVIVSAALLAAIAFVCLAANAQNDSCSDPDNKVYDGRIVQVKGKVTILNHPELGKTPGTGMYLVFQREDCKRCLVATHAQLDGSYEVFLGEGRYKLIARDAHCDYGGAGCDCYDLLAPKQARYFEAKRGPSPIVFDIDIVLPKK